MPRNAIDARPARPPHRAVRRRECRPARAGCRARRRPASTSAPAPTFACSQIAEVRRPDGAPERALGDVARTIKRGAQRLVDADPRLREAGDRRGQRHRRRHRRPHRARLRPHRRRRDRPKFIEVFVRRGITPDGGGAYLLPRLIGLAQGQGAGVPGRRPHRGRRRAHRPDQQGACRRRRPRQGRRRLGGTPGAGPDEGDLAVQVAAQPVARLRPCTARSTTRPGPRSWPRAPTTSARASPPSSNAAPSSSTAGDAPIG